MQKKVLATLLLSIFFIIDCLSIAISCPIDQCAVPPFMASQIPPLVMLVMGRDHKLYYEAYNDASDLDEDGVLDVGYKHSIDYYGYFDSHKCYKYDSASGVFEPTRTTADKYCGGADEWSGNFLNWLTMSRMDVLRKVLYGGYRSTDTTTSTVLEGVFIPQDAHSWGKEYSGNDTRLLTPYDDPSSSCQLPDEPATWDQDGKILFVIYDDDKDGIYGNDHSEMMTSFEPKSFSSMTYLSKLDTTDNYSITNRIETGNYMLVAEFYVNNLNEGNWYFAVDSDDGSEVEIDGTIVASFYGPHAFCHCQSNQSIAVNLSEGWHRIIVRLRENTGGDGVLVWFKNSTHPFWTTFGSLSLTLRAPTIEDECSLKTFEFIETGTPSYGGTSINLTNERHLFCVTSLADGAPHRIRVIRNSTHRVWEWASKERPVCDNSLGTPDEELVVRVKVCDPSVGLEDNCVRYPANSYKPTGLLQKYGEGTGEKVCSQTFTSCNNDNDCQPNESCILAAPMYFGLLTGSYTKNLSGGVLRKNVSPIGDEVDPNTGILLQTPGIIDTINTLRVTGFLYSNHSYTSTAYGESCGWITDHPLEEGECRMWGNPIAEMMYETERYFAGKSSPTSDFNYFSFDGTDNGLPLPKADWEDPYELYPYCSKPSILIISDINPSYDSDKVPGSAFNNFTGDLSGLDAKTLANQIGENENLDSNQHFIGESNGIDDFICSAKDTSDLGALRGLCPEEPTKQGSYYSAALAYYGKTMFDDQMDRPDISTYSVALSSPVPDIKIQVGSHEVTLVPIGKSVSGCYITACYTKCTLTTDPVTGLQITNCSSDAYCPSNQIVDFYVTEITPTKGQFRINFEDVEQGADHDMDAIVTYNYEVIDDNTVKISLDSSVYASGCIDQVLGFVISGTTEDGVYLPVRDADSGSCDSNTPTLVCSMPLTWEKTFTVNNNTTAATLMKNPLWYAAKWGGFSDINGNNIPDSPLEWDKDNDGVPDNYFFVVNPLKLEQQLDKALRSILRKTSSGTSVSVLTTKTKKGNLTNQAVFYQEKGFEAGKTVNWVGYLYTYWLLNLKKVQNIREDNVNPFFLDILGDNILDFIINEYGNLNIAAYSSAANGTRTSVVNMYESLDEVHPIWEAGDRLKESSPNERNILYAGLSSNGTLYSFDLDNLDANTSGLKTLLTSCNETTPCLGSNETACQQNLIRFLRGEEIQGCRSRQTGNGIWKLGDIIYSTPQIVEYKDYSLVFVGANDGMLHAFREGKLRTDGLSTNQLVRLCSDSNTTCDVSKLGHEDWAFIPTNVMPYLRYLARPDYGDCHLYLVDLSPYIISEDTNDDGYIDKRILIGGLRFGGACGCSGAECVNPPSELCPDPSSEDCIGLSSYFALDITDPANPQFLWEFSDPKLGFSYSGPAYIKRENAHFVMFVSGPTDYRGSAGLDLKIFVLKLDDDFKIEQVYKFDGDGHDEGFTKIDELASYNNTFGGRLFTNGIDYDDNGTTDAVFFGINQFTGTVWQGNVIGVLTGDDDPNNWSFETVFNSAREPVTSKIEYMKCFNMNYIYFGTGRWFYKTDEEGQTAFDVEKLYGVRIDECLNEGHGHCSINNAHNAQEICNQIELNEAQNIAWTVEDLEPRDDEYFKERTITDPTISTYNMVFFTTTQPSSDICKFGGRSRLWALNCATGGNMTSSCPGIIPSPTSSGKVGGTLLLQLSRGNIEDVKVDEEAFSYEGGKSSEWMTGIPPESSTPLTGGPPGSEGELILWLEK